MEFTVVHFLETNEVEAVPKKWITENSKLCYWPNFRNTTKITAAIKSCVTHSDDWKKHSVNIKGHYPTLEKARAGARKAEVMSDIGSESENPSKRTRSIIRPEGPAQTKTESYQPIRKLISPPITAQFVSIDDNLDTSESESDTSGTSFVEPPIIAVEHNIGDLRNSTKPLIGSAQVNIGGKFDIDSPSAFLMQKPHPSTSVESISGFEKSVLRSLETIKFRQLQHEEALESLKASIFRIGQQKQSSLEAAGIKLPIISHSDLDDLENNVSEDSSYKSELIHLLSNMGGGDAESCTRRAWAACIKDDIKSNCNWAGRGPKRGVKMLTITECVFAAVMVNYPDCKRSVYEAVTKDWLKQAPARLRYLTVCEFCGIEKKELWRVRVKFEWCNSHQ